MDNEFYSQPDSTIDNQPKKQRIGVSIGKVFLYVFFGLLISAAVAFGVGALIYKALYPLDFHSQFQITKIISIVTTVLLLIDTVVMSLVTLRGKHNILIPAIIYTILIGLFASSFVMFVDWRALGMTFGVTAVLFGFMSLIAFGIKGNLKPLLLVIVALIIGLPIIVFCNWMIFLGTGTPNVIINCIVSVGIFALMMFVSMYDLWNIKKIAQNGAMNNDIALYCAFQIYVDFVFIFLRVLSFLGIFSNDK